MTRESDTTTPTAPLSASEAMTLALAHAESIAMALDEADLTSRVCGINLQGLGGAGPTPRIVVHAKGSAATVRIARLLFATYDPPVHDPDHPTLLSYRGEAPDLGYVEVFGPSSEQERQDARSESMRRTRRPR